MSLPMQGQLFKYAGKQGNCAFRTGSHRRHVVLVGGLGDALLFAPYIPLLASRLNTIGWSLVQTMLPSSLTGWGISSLDEDADGLAQLTAHLQTVYSSEVLVLAGHSTGCQDAVRYANRDGVQPLDAVILQAPVSDQDYLAMSSDTPDRIQLCEQMIAEGHAEDIAFRDDDGTPVTARRFLAVAKPGGDDDYFSFDFSHDERQAKLGRLAEVPTLSLFGGADECVPPAISAHDLRDRFATVLTHPLSQSHVIEGAGHSLDGHEQEAVSIMVKFVNSIALKG